MKSTLITATFAFAATSVAAPSWPNWSNGGHWGNWGNWDGSNAPPANADPGAPYQSVLSQEQANDIVHGYQSVLQNQTYNGMLPTATAQKYVAADYKEYSDSVLSLISRNNTVSVL
jgi:hypothetical protein